MTTPIKWTTSRDEVPRVTVRLNVRLSLDDLASILAYVQEVDCVTPALLTNHQVREAVRAALLHEGIGVRDRLGPDDDGVTVEHYRVAGRAYGEPS